MQVLLLDHLQAVTSEWEHGNYCTGLLRILSDQHPFQNVNIVKHSGNTIMDKYFFYNKINILKPLAIKTRNEDTVESLQFSWLIKLFIYLFFKIKISCTVKDAMYMFSSVFQEHVYQDCQSRYSKQEILHQTYINFCMYRYMFKYFRSSPV